MNNRNRHFKKLEKSSIYNIELSSYEAPKIIEGKGKKEWVEFGEDNNYFQYLIDTYNGSTTHNSVVNNISKLIYGQGLDATDSSRKPNDFAQMKMLFRPDVLRKAVKDFKLLGQYALQLIYNNSGDKIVKVEHLPMHLVRAGKCNKDGIIDTYFYSDNWSDIKKFPPTPIPAFGYGEKKLELLVVGNYTVGQKYYSNVDYLGAIPYAVFESKISKYLINEVDNSFSPTSIITFLNGVPPVEEQEQIVNKLKETSSGVNGKKFMVGFGEGQETKPSVEKIPLDNAADIYKYLSEESRDKLLLGHGVTSGLLFGIPSANGFSSNADELKNASILFDNMVIRPFQQSMIDSFNQILGFNNVILDLRFKPLNALDEKGDLAVESKGNIIVDSLNSLSPLVATKVLESMTPDEIRNLISLPATNIVNTQMSSQNPLDGYGEEIDLSKWELVSSEKVDYSKEEELDVELSKLNSTKLSLIDKAVNFAKTGVANPNASSSQDGEQFISRYRYSGNPNPERPFCKMMMEANKLYRKEDIDRMSNDAQTNPSFGLGGSDTYDIFLWKGGGKMSKEFPNGTCKHYWSRETYRKKTDVNSPLAETVSPSQARKAGEILPTVDNRAYKAPHDMR